MEEQDVVIRGVSLFDGDFGEFGFGVPGLCDGELGGAAVEDPLVEELLEGEACGLFGGVDEVLCDDVFKGVVFEVGGDGFLVEAAAG